MRRPDAARGGGPPYQDRHRTLTLTGASHYTDQTTVIEGT